jgi:hypothetical protein
MKMVMLKQIILFLLSISIIITFLGCPDNVFYGLDPKPNDTDGPAITIINPTENQVLSGILSVVGTSTDKYEVKKMSIKLDNGSYIDMNGLYSWHYEFDTAVMSAGAHTVTLRSEDTFGNALEVVRNFIVDQTVPNVAITFDYENRENYIRGTNIALNGTASDNNSISKIQISFDGGITYSNINNTSNNNTVWSYTISDTATFMPGGGQVNAVLRAVDSAGLLGFQSFQLYVDAADPTVTITVPLNDITIDASSDLAGNRLTVAGTCDDDLRLVGPGGLRDVTITVGTLSPVVLGESQFTNSYTTSIDITSIKSNGPTTVTVQVRDWAGSSTSAQITVSFDDTPPSFIAGSINTTEKGLLDNDLSKRNSNFKDASYVLNGQVTDPDGSLDILITKVEVQLINSNAQIVYASMVDNNNLDPLDDGKVTAGGNWSHLLSLTSLAEGDYTLKLRVTDNVGGFGFTTRAIRIDKTAPQVILSDPSTGVYVGGNAVNIAGFADATGSGIYSIRYQINQVTPSYSEDNTYTSPNFTGLNANIVTDGSGTNMYFSRIWDTTLYSQGVDITITIIAEDLAGNPSIPDTGDPSILIVRKDPSVPRISILTYDHPINTAYINQSVINGRYINDDGTLKGTATDDSQITQLEVAVDTGGFIAQNPAPGMNINWSYTLPGNLTEGAHTFYFRVTDDSTPTAKLNTTAIKLNVDNTCREIDASAFTLTLADGSGTSYYHGNVYVAGTSSDTRAGVESLSVTVDEGAGGDGPEALMITGTSSFSGTWNTMALPTNGGNPVVVGTGIMVTAKVTDKAGNTITAVKTADVRPYISAISKTSAYLGETGITITGQNFKTTSIVTVGGGDVTEGVRTSTNITFDIPAGFTPGQALSSGPVIVTTTDIGSNPITNTAQTPVKMDLFHSVDIYTLDGPSFPALQFYNTNRIVGFGIGTNPRTLGLTINTTTNTYQPSGLNGGSLTHISLAYVNDTRQYLTFYSSKLSPAGIYLVRSLNRLAGIEGGFPKLICDNGLYSSMKVDAINNVHIAFYDATNTSLKYMKSTDAFNSVPGAVVLAGSTTDAGKWVAMDLDSNNYPHIVYYEYETTSLKYIYYNGSTWSTPVTIDNNNAGDYGNSIVINRTTGRIHVSYYNGNSGDLMYTEAAYAGAPFSTPVTADGLVISGMYSSIALDGAGNPHIAYADFTNQRCKYVRRVDGEWKAIFVALSGAPIFPNTSTNYTATGKDNNGFMHMIYPTSGGIKEAIYLVED